MSFLATAFAVLALQTGWTWTLYEGEGPLVLAHEVPDTPRLRAVLECEPGAGVARLNLYGGGASGGIATVVSGGTTAQTESVGVADHRSLAMRADHPVFGQFVLTGQLAVTVAGRSQEVIVEAAHLAKLRRFAELCGG
ncbi:hypothetical protein IP78_13260 [Brevundimonas sp. AAP58]|uniref:hypothetical protein n=1 Tax=Brevundimonas sp. AAP58 TaxID=1523422 RepID=UPI0006B9F5DA|nr:hypothetical protein [Brevundimonas sp. AAP58]KPF76493.1 hypothetical protein IP78_13260 [Brevundimonas sp. AAP58]